MCSTTMEEDSDDAFPTFDILSKPKASGKQIGFLQLLEREGYPFTIHGLIHLFPDTFGNLFDCTHTITLSPDNRNCTIDSVIDHSRISQKYPGSADVRITDCRFGDLNRSSQGHAASLVKRPDHHHVQFLLIRRNREA